MDDRGLNSVEDAPIGPQGGSPDSARGLQDFRSMTPSLVHQFVRHSAEQTPLATALIEPGREISYADLNGLCNRVANLLLTKGVHRGDRVVLALKNCIELVACYFGTMKAGAVAVPLPPGPRSDRFAHVVEDCSPTVCIVDTPTAEEQAAALCGAPVVLVHRNRNGSSGNGKHADPETRPDPVQRPQIQSHSDLRDALESVSDTEPDVRMIGSDLAAIIYTSGSTGAPRGVMLSHLNIVANTESVVTYLRLSHADRVMCVLPFYYVYGLSLLHTHMRVGASVVIDNRLAFPNAVLQAMTEYCVTGLAGVPSTFALLLHRSSLMAMSFPHLRYVTQAGGPMPPARIREWLEKGPPAPLYVMYGATEASARLTYLEPRELSAHMGSIGKPIPNVEVIVLKEDGQQAGPGEVGELVARGSNISRGYWNNPEDTRASFGPFGFRTGDLGYADADGFLYVVGRRNDMLKVGAHRVSAKEIEDVLSEHPAFHEVAVVGAPHDILGEAPVAFVVLREGQGLDTEEVGEFCRRRLPSHKLPVGVILRSEIPKNCVGKFDKGALRQAAREVIRTSHRVARTRTRHPSDRMNGPETTSNSP
ncbi:MAG: Acyl-CoA synthetase (AMP-forming)/AMP-acid ligase [Deltaproteobacteria bacterium]|nr:Acyl-CoA synthetase (AMP-forming)/AMP-acid ligase [Deltaproteobacteria bacterium]